MYSFLGRMGFCGHLSIIAPEALKISFYFQVGKKATVENTMYFPTILTTGRQNSLKWEGDSSSVFEGAGSWTKDGKEAGVWLVLAVLQFGRVRVSAEAPDQGIIWSPNHTYSPANSTLHFLQSGRERAKLFSMPLWHWICIFIQENNHDHHALL